MKQVKTVALYKTSQGFVLFFFTSAVLYLLHTHSQGTNFIIKFQNYIYGGEEGGTVPHEESFTWALT